MEFGDIVIGMRVRAMIDFGPVSVGDEGAVVTLACGVGVRWDDFSARKHNLDGACEAGHGWWFPSKNLEEIFEGVDLDDVTQDELVSVLEGAYGAI